MEASGFLCPDPTVSCNNQAAALRTADVDRWERGGSKSGVAQRLQNTTTLRVSPKYLEGTWRGY